MFVHLRQPIGKKPIIARCFLAGVLFAAASPAVSESAPLTLEQAVSRALAGHPVVKTQGSAITATEKQAALEALAPPLVVGVDMENVAGSGDLQGATSVESTLRLSRVIELGGKRDARLALGHSEVDRQRVITDVAQLDIAAATSRRFIQVLAIQAELASAEEQVRRGEKTRAQVKNGVTAGRNPEADGYQADIALGKARLVREDAEHELDTARMALVAQWGDTASTAIAVTGNLDDLPEIEDFATLAARLPDTVDQQVYARESAALAAKQQVAAAAAKPDLSVSVGLRHLEALGDQALVFGVAAPLGSGERSVLGSSRYGAELTALAGRQEAAYLDAHQRLYSLYQELQHARHVVEVHRDQLIPLAEKALQANQQGYELGRFSFVALSQAHQELAELNIARIEAAAKYHLLLIDIERLTALSGVPAP